MSVRTIAISKSTHQLVHGWAYRLAQALAFARPQPMPPIPADIATRLRPGTIERFRALTPADQRHMIAVSQRLRASGAPDDLWLAGLLHDVGKADGGHHVRLLDRGLWVLLGPLTQATSRIREYPTMPRRWCGLWLAAHHARVGADLLRDLGYDERICWLVAHHEDADSAALDDGLSRLMEADGARHTIPAGKGINLGPLEGARVLR